MATERSIKAKALRDKADKQVMLAHSFSTKKHVIVPKGKRQVSIKDWLVFEKLDGIRATFKNGKLYSRYGNELVAPRKFIEKIETSFLLNENTILDGELISNKGFQHAVSVVRDKTNKVSMNYWKDITFTVFDYIPTDKDEKFTDRLRYLNMIYINESKNVSVLQQIGHIVDIKEIQTFHKYVKDYGGEGLILRNPNGLYTLGRSWDLLKVKEFIDIEAVVIGHLPGEGRNKNAIAGITCRLPNGIEFDCGTGFSDIERKNPPEISSKVTVRFFEYTEEGKPRFPVFVSKRDYE